MHVTIKTSGHELTEDTRTLVEEKFSALDKLALECENAPMLECEIEQSIAVERAGAKYRSEGNLIVDGLVLRAEAEGQTLEEAVDGVRDDLSRQLKSAKGKRRDLVRRGGAALKRMLRFGR